MRLATATILLALFRATAASGDPLTCDLSAYKAQPGLTAALAGEAVTLAWSGDGGDQLRFTVAVSAGAPVVRDLAIRTASGEWHTVASNLTPEFRIASGIRRMSNQQIQPLNELKVPITADILDKNRWDAFWDAPLFIGPPRQGGNPPPAGGVANQPPMPRKPEEIHRDTIAYRIAGCSVTTRGARIELRFPGVKLGVFDGALQFTMYRGTNLIRQEVIASTNASPVAYKYDAGLSGFSTLDARAAWRDTANTWQENRFGGAVNSGAVALKAANRLVVGELTHGSVAAFPPPHTFFWAREIETNLGYNYLRKDSAASFAIGVRQAEREEVEQYQENFALYSAPPGSQQHMPIYFYVSAEPASQTADKVLAFTHDDRFKPLPGYQVMAHHYHMDLGQRLREARNVDADIPDFAAIRSIGVTIASQIDSVFTGPEAGRRGDWLETTKASVEGARHHSDRNFLVLPNQEVYGSPLGGHTDLLFSHPVYWGARQPGQPLVESDPTYGKVYHVGAAEDFIEMARREDILISMPHPRTKGSTGYPDAVKDEAFFKDPHYQGVGFRWGMGLDLSEQRLCDRRCLTLLDDMSNWSADWPGPPKYLIAITETRFKAPGDDVYAASPVNYVKLDRLPSIDDVSPVVKALMKGDSFISSGEVLVPSFALQGTGAKRTVVASVEWTFPLEFVEVVWGDGKTTGRTIVAATDLPPFGSHRFEIPFDASGKKWVRFAAWDSAGNGAVLQPVKLTNGN